MIHDTILTKGDVELIIEWKDGKKEIQNHKNTVLESGRVALAKCLANQIGDKFDFHIARMLFGDGGTYNGVKKSVNAGREGLFGVTRLSKPILSSLNPSVPYQVIFTAVVRYEDAVGLTLNEMGLQMSNGQLYSLLTFPDLNKTEDMQITFNWRLSFI